MLFNSIPEGEKPSDVERSPPTPSTPSNEPEDAIYKSQGDIDAYASSFSPGWRFRVAFASLCVIVLMAALDATSLSVAIPKITTSLNGTAIEGFWTGTSFLLTSTVFQPVFGSLSDIFGRKPMIYVSLVLFGVGAIMAAVTQGSMNLLLAGRSIQGVGGGGVLVLAEVVTTDLVPLRFRGNFLSAIAAMWAIGSVSGPVIGGVFAQEATWRWIFWINLPFIGVGTPLIVIFLKLYFKSTTIIDQLKRIDWVGGFLFIASTTGLLIPITWGGTNYSWTSWRTLVPLLVCIAGLAAFVAWEEKVKDPLIRIRVIKNRSAAVTYIGDFLHGVILWCALYYMPLYFQVVKGQSPIMSGVDLFPTTFTVAPCAVIVGATIQKLGVYRWAVWAGWSFATLGFGLMIMLDVHTSTVAWIFITLVAGIGTGMLYPSLTYAIMAASTNEDQAYAVSLFTFFRAAGQCIGVAVGGTIFQNGIKREALKYASIAARASEFAENSTGLVEIIKAMPDSVAKTDLIQSYADALSIIWILTCALSALALVISFWTQHSSLDRMLETDHGFKHKPDADDGECKSPLQESA